MTDSQDKLAEWNGQSMIWTPNFKLYRFMVGENPLYIPALNESQAKDRANMAYSPLPDTFESWLLWRWLGRYDLLFLCTRILGYRDVNYRVHSGILDNVQKFKPSIENIKTRTLTGLKPNQLALPKLPEIIDGFVPGCDLWDLEGWRNYLNMIPRGHLKTSVITEAHSIQFVLNYPNVRLCIDSHTDGNVKGFLSAVKKHWTTNDMFRYLYVEHVPQGKAVNDFGNQEYFDTLARTVWKREHTFNILSVGSASAGKHYEGIFHDDLVDKENVRTADQIQVVKTHMAACDPLIHRQNTKNGSKKGWEYLTGTFYDFSDLNYATYEIENAKPKEQRIWSLNVQSAAPNWPDPKGPYLWPERFGYNELKQIELDPTKGPEMLAAQYLMNPIPPGGGLIESKEELIWTPRKVINELYARLSLYTAVDLAGMDTSSKSKDNDYSCITTAGFGTDGHLYVFDIYHGRPNPQQVIEELFALAARHPRLIYIKMEKEAHARVLLPFLKAEEAKRNVYLPVMPLTRDNQTSKQQKIRGLQPWFKRGMIHFADDLPCKMQIINEVMRFPKFNHDDILDTLCDLMASRDGGVTHEVMNAQKEVEQGNGTLDTKDFISSLFNREPDSGVDSITGW